MKRFIAYIFIIFLIIVVVIFAAFPFNNYYLSKTINNKRLEFKDNEFSPDMSFRVSSKPIELADIIGVWKTKANRGYYSQMIISEAKTPGCNLCVRFYLATCNAEYGIAINAKFKPENSIIVLDSPMALSHGDAFKSILIIDDTEKTFALLPISLKKTDSSVFRKCASPVPVQRCACPTSVRRVENEGRNAETGGEMNEESDEP